jgi:hypothetical protein
MAVGATPNILRLRISCAAASRQAEGPSRLTRNGLSIRHRIGAALRAPRPSQQLLDGWIAGSTGALRGIMAQTPPAKRPGRSYMESSNE